VVFLAERADWHLAVGAALVALAMGVVNRRPKPSTIPAGPAS